MNEINTPPNLTLEELNEIYEETGLHDTELDEIFHFLLEVSSLLNAKKEAWKRKYPDTPFTWKCLTKLNVLKFPSLKERYMQKRKTLL